MENTRPLYELISHYLPILTVIALTVGGLLLANWSLLHRHKEIGAEKRIPRQLTLLMLTGLGIILIILALPVSDSTRAQLLSLFGLVLTAIIALSSTTFVANAMAGIMLRSVGSFRPGDFVRVGEQLGRVTERGLFHTEIQTEDRDLTTLPNLYLVSQPVTVVHASGTIVSIQLSLGYDVSRARVEPLLIDASEKVGLTEPFVQITELGDYAVSYRIAGFLTDVKHLLTTRSNLCKQVLDTLHDNSIEIVSPAFMNQRQLAEGTRIIPRQLLSPSDAMPPADKRTPEELIFDKAEQAKKVEELRATKKTVETEIKTLTEQLTLSTTEEKAALKKQIARLKKRLLGITTRLDKTREDN